MESKNEKQFAPENPPPYTDNTAENDVSAGKSGGMDGVAPLHAGAPIVVPVVVATAMGPKPAAIVCPSCHAQIVTRVEHINTTKTHLFAALLCVLGGLLCCWIPYCVDSCQNADHYCPNCNTYIGVYEH